MCAGRSRNRAYSATSRSGVPQGLGPREELFALCPCAPGHYTLECAQADIELFWHVPYIILQEIRQRGLDSVIEIMTSQKPVSTEVGCVSALHVPPKHPQYTQTDMSCGSSPTTSSIRTSNSSSYETPPWEMSRSAVGSRQAPRLRPR